MLNKLTLQIKRKAVSSKREEIEALNQLYYATNDATLSAMITN